MTAPIRRILLGRVNRFYGRMRVYLVPNGLEVDELDHGRIIRKRVFFDDVLAVTHHRYYGRAFLILTGLLAGLFGLIAFGLLRSRGDGTAGVVMLAIMSVFLLAFAVRLVLRVDGITVFGRRSKAELLFSFRKQRARDVYEDLCRRVREAQPEPAPPPAITADLPPAPPPAESASDVPPPPPASL